jgi:hypothetical protein
VNKTQDFLGALPVRGIRKTNRPEGIAMFNMATMAADECREDAEDRAWRRWTEQVGKILGRYVGDGSPEAEEWLSDLYLDGCTPQEAVTEMLAQQALEAV